MCDYSLEHYQSRNAETNETYTSHRFPSGSVGFIDKKDPTVAVCMACDMRLKLEKLPPNIQTKCGVGATDIATFTQLSGGLYRDGVRFSTGKTALLQELGPGVEATWEPLVAAVAKETIDSRKLEHVG
jgi:hypothetical protein